MSQFIIIQTAASTTKKKHKFCINTHTHISARTKRTKKNKINKNKTCEKTDINMPHKPASCLYKYYSDVHAIMIQSSQVGEGREWNQIFRHTNKPIERSCQPIERLWILYTFRISKRKQNEFHNCILLLLLQFVQINSEQC